MVTNVHKPFIVFNVLLIFVQRRMIVRKMMAI